MSEMDDIKTGEKEMTGVNLEVHREQDILEDQVTIPQGNVSYWTLFRYAGTLDTLGLLFSGLCAAAGGAVLPY